MDLLRDLQESLGPGFTLERELTGGGMARVFVAHEATLGRKVVVKALSPDLVGELSVERFRREIRLAASLQQANIVPVHAAGEVGGLPYYTMPFVEGESLRLHLAQRGPLPVQEVVSIMRDIARALAFAHDHGVVHRDIKPENLLLSGSTAVVTDFGIAKAIEASRTSPDAPTLTGLGARIGTPAYMSPEQASGDPGVDRRTDIYALGIVAYELLSGATPFAGRTHQALLAAQVMEPPVDIRERRPDTGAELARLVMRCLEKDPARRPQSGHEVLRALEFGAGLPIAALHPQPVSASTTKPMIAVLPLANMSASADDAYFSDGVTEDIIAQLSQIATLRVISRTSAMCYKESRQNVKEIAATLGATHVVEGSVRRSANRLRIVVQLIDASTDEHLWVQTFDRDMTDVFAIQSEVAEQVVGALRVRLAPDERKRIARKPTENQEAYNSYLLARHHANLATADGFERAMDFYRRAVSADPNFARAWASLAQAQLFHVAGYYGVRPREAASKVVECASRALQLDPEIAEAHSALGYVATLLDFDWETDRLRQECALRLAPNLATVHLAYGNHLVTVGRFADAVEEARHALELDPASEYVHVHANWLRYSTRRFDEALAGLEAAEAQFGRKVLPLTRGATLIAVGRAAETVESFRELYERMPISWNLGHLAWGLAAAGRTTEARAALGELHERAKREYVWPLAISLAYAHLGDMDPAFEHLERCYDDRAAWIQFPYSPTFDPFLSDPRFESIRRRIGARPPSV